MMKRAFLSLIVGAMTWVPHSSAQEAKITAFRTAQVDLFNESGTERVGQLDSEAVTLPLPIKAMLPNGNYVIELDGTAYSVRKRTARTDRVYELSSTCSNQLAASKTAASRGLGNGECQ